jgi:hypothetical protein
MQPRRYGYTMTTYRMTLADGTAFDLTSRKPPRNWKSRLMARAAYGTDFRGAMFTATKA